MKRTWVIALALGASAFALYCASLPRSYSFWDTGELQTVAAILGIAHPPACPAFVLLGWAFVRAIPVGEAAWRVNVMCAFAVAASTGILFSVSRRFGVPPLVAAACALGFATAGVPWHDATRAEVQDLALLLRVGALAFALRWLDSGRLRDVFLMALATGLAGATHGITVLILPALALLVAGRAEWRDPRVFALIAAGIALGLLPYAYLPLRSQWLYAHRVDPTLRLGLPAGLPFWDYDHPATWPNFVRVVTGADFNVHSGFAGFVALERYPAFAAALVTRVAAAYGYAGAIVAALGAAAFVLSRRLDRIAIVVAALLPVPYTESYKELQDPDRYYLLALWCAALAIGSAFEPLADLFALRRPSIARFAMGAGLVASFVAATPGRLGNFKQTQDRSAANYVAEIREIVPSDAIVLAEWAYSTPLAYAAYVENTLGERTVVAASPQQYLAYVPGWLASRPVYIVSFDSALELPGFTLESLKNGPYYAYRITKQR